MLFCPTGFLYLFFLVDLEISCNFNFMLLSKQVNFYRTFITFISLFLELVSLTLAQILTRFTWIFTRYLFLLLLIPVETSSMLWFYGNDSILRAGF